jgi:uncharacterized protein YajQ (UPF0234 family)
LIGALPACAADPGASESRSRARRAVVTRRREHDAGAQGSRPAAGTPEGRAMPSFDIVSRVDLQEVDNAIDQARREIGQRFDFKGTNTEITRDGGDIQVRSADEFKVKAAVEVLQSKLARRQVPLKALRPGPVQGAAGGTAKQQIAVQQGVSVDHAREIVKLVKQSKLKIQAAIQGDEVRVSGKKRDDLQAIMTRIKAAEFDAPLQFVNFRE